VEHFLRRDSLTTMKTNLRFAIYLILFTSIIEATPQKSDLIIILNDTIPLYSSPLEKYLDKKNISSEPLEKYGFSTGCYRYYRAIWQIKNDSLFLVDVVSCVSDTVKIPFNLFFDNMESTEPIFAKWVTDTLWAEIGNNIFYLHEGYGWFYDKEKCLNVNQGVVVDINVFDYSDRVFISDLYQNQFKLKEFCCSKIDWNKIPITENEIKIIVFLGNDTSYVTKNVANANKSYEEEALRIVSELKPTKLFQFNREVILSYNIPIFFSKAIMENCKK